MSPPSSAAPGAGAGACIRVDKWLWAARFYKTRSLASAAIHAGHVRVNGEGVKAARALREGDLLDLTIGATKWTVIVRALSGERRGAPEAQALYEESAESCARRMAAAARLTPSPGSELRGRPTKKARRQIRGFNENF